MALAIASDSSWTQGEDETHKRASSASANDEGDDGEPSSRRGAAVDVLVVDDEEDVRSSLADVLQVSGYSVLVAEDGFVALKRLREFDVGMILLDLKMPRMDGVAFLKAVISPPPIVILSAFSPDKDLNEDVGSKVVTQLQKPVSPVRLLSVVAATLGH